MFKASALRCAPVMTGQLPEVSGAAFESGFLVTPGLCAMGGSNRHPVTPGLSLMGETN
jgi:hypothetical protein